VIFGDLYWVNLPDRGGREQRGRRPAIIWQDIQAFLNLPTVVTIPLTSRLDALRFAATVRIVPSSANGLTTPSVAFVFQVGATDIRRIQQRLGRLEDETLTQIAELAKRLQKLT